MVSAIRTRFAHRQAGQGAIEYALIVVGVSTATQVAIQSLGERVSDVFKSVGDALGSS